MTNLHEFIMKDVRCFAGEHRANIRPITLLIGENSTGKTSFLGGYRALNRATNHENRIPRWFDEFDFNVEPFHMGAFRDIVYSRMGPQGRIDEFTLGFSAGSGDKKYDAVMNFIESWSEPKLSSVKFNFSKKSFLNIKIVGDDNVTISFPGHNIRNLKIRTLKKVGAVLILGLSVDKKHAEWLGIEKKEAAALVAFIKKEIGSLGIPSDFFMGSRSFMYPDRRRERSFAPVRSKAKRTYDPGSRVPTATGEHIPTLMARLKRSKDERWKMLHEGLVKFGRQSGLFADIKVKVLGQDTIDPFQLYVKVRSGAAFSNIVDVGYGVNQVLPILVEVLYAEPTTFILQQPEVHLHPRGQAELATLLAKSVRHKEHSFLIETQSEQIIGRMRMAVRDKIISAEELSILYFAPAKKGGGVKIHNMHVDEMGNLKNIPSGYRDFFMQETHRLLGFDLD